VTNEEALVDRWLVEQGGPSQEEQGALWQAEQDLFVAMARDLRCLQNYLTRHSSFASPLCLTGSYSTPLKYFLIFSMM
jgi:hypothetical protein